MNSGILNKLKTRWQGHRRAAVVLTALVLALVTLTTTMLVNPTRADRQSPTSCAKVISGFKTVTGTNIPIGTTFTFTLTQWSTNSASGSEVVSGRVTAPLTATAVTDSAAGKTYNFNFPEVTFTATGTYYFRITETGIANSGGGSAGWTANTEVKFVTVYVKRDTLSSPYNDLYAFVNYPENSGSSHNPYKWENPSKSKPFGSANYYGVFAFEDFNANGADIEVGAAVGGKYTQNSPYFPVGAVNRGYSKTAWPIRPYEARLLVRGNFDMTYSGTTKSEIVGGSVVVSSTSQALNKAASGSPFGISLPTTANAALPDFTYSETTGLTETLKSFSSFNKVPIADLNTFFSSAKTSLEALSNNFRAGKGISGNTLVVNTTSTTLTPGGNSGYSQYDTIIFNYTTSSTAYPKFTIVFPTDFTGDIVINYNTSASSLSASTNSNFPTVRSGATTVSGSDARRYYPQRIIWNFPSTVESIDFYGSYPEIVGSVLAPWTNVTLGAAPMQTLGGSTGTLLGSVVCKSYTSYNSSECHHHDNSGNDVGTMTFSNNYDNTVSTTYNGSIPGTKTLTGTPTSSQNFVFTLTSTNSSGTAQALASGVTVSGTGTGNTRTITVPMSAAGSSNFKFDISGMAANSTHYFTLVETTGGSGGSGIWTNATNQYLIQVSVSSAGVVSYSYKTRATSAGSWSSSWTNITVSGSSWSWVSSSSVSYSGNYLVPNETGASLATGTINSSNVASNINKMINTLYCADVDTNVAYVDANHNPYAHYTPVGSENITAPSGSMTGSLLNNATNRANVLWVARNGYWATGVVTTTPKSSGPFTNMTWPTTGGDYDNLAWLNQKYGASLTQFEAFMATQFAVWRFSNGTNPSSASALGSFKGLNLPIAQATKIYDVYTKMVAEAQSGKTVMPEISLAFDTSGATISNGWYGPVKATATPDKFGTTNVSIALTRSGSYTLSKSTSGGSTTLSVTSGESFYINLGSGVTTLPSDALLTAKASAEVTVGGKPGESCMFVYGLDRSKGQIVCGVDKGANCKVKVEAEETLGGGSFKFENKYEIPSTTKITINGTKNVTGASAPSSTFGWTLTELNSASATDVKSGGVTRTTSRTDAGSFSFPEITGLEAGKTYYYSVAETTGGSGGSGSWSNDTTARIVTVTVTSGTSPTATANYTTGSSTFTNTYTAPGGGLTIKKIVDNGGSASTRFSFTVYNSSNQAVNLTQGSISVSPSSDTYDLENGVVTMTGGGTVTITNLPAGTYYVTEAATNYTTKWEIAGGASGSTNTSGNMAVSGTSSPTVTFTNTPKQTNWTPGAVKNTTGKNMSADQFSFELWEAESDGTKKGGTYLQRKTNTVGNVMSNVINFDSISLTTTETKYYLLIETGSTQTGWTLDTTQYLFKVEPTDVNGQLTVTSSAVTFGKRTGSTGAFTDWKTFNGAVQPEFNNTFTPNSTSWTPGATKTSQKKDMVDHQFGFELYNSNVSGTEDSLRETVYNTAGSVSNLSFTTINYTAAGEYYYLLKEIVSNDLPYWIYDTTQYLIKVNVINDNGDLKVNSVTYSSRTGNTGSFTGSTNFNATKPAFVNLYSPPKTNEFIPITVRKDIRGKSSSTDSFDFILTEMEKNPDNSFTVKAGGLTQRRTIDLSVSPTHSFAVTDLEPGTYYYRITEDSGSPIPGWVYDDSEYIVTIVVTHDPSTDKFSYVVTCPEGFNELEQIVFTNDYTNYNFEFMKVDRDENPLGGVEFELYDCKYADSPAPHTHSPQASGEPGCCWELHDTQISGLDGMVRFTDLPPGNYMLVETKTQPGYQLPMGQWMISIDADGNITVEARGDETPPAFKVGTTTGVYMLPNYPSFDMPMTGGLTALLLSITGIILMGLVSIKLFLVYRGRRKRKSGMAT